jgi:signal transduction histidine kinase
VRDLQPTENSIDIEYVGLDFQTGESLRYQYKLERAGADWSVPVDRRILNFGNLAPGRYRFLVRAINSKSIPSATPAMVTFTILRPVWQRWWFVTISLGAVAAAAWSFHRYRVKRELELADVRAQIALDLHDDIGSNLTKISILSELARQRQRGDAAPDDLLAAIATIARESVAAMGDIVWAINPQRDRLLDLVQRMR